MSEEAKTNQPQSLSPEHVSLEERYARQEKSPGQVVEQPKIVEKAQEKSAAESDATYKAILSKVSDTQSDENTVMNDASNLDQKMNRESQITHLIDLAMNKGVAHAVKVAQKAEDYYLLDQLHDRLLADELHDALVQRGLIE